MSSIGIPGSLGNGKGDILKGMKRGRESSDKTDKSYHHFWEEEKRKDKQGRGLFDSCAFFKGTLNDTDKSYKSYQ